MRPWHGPNGPSSVRGGDPSAPLPDPATIADTPALAAISEGLGAYLLAQGYVAEHPLLYVDERDDPYVYVRFDISEDGLGFIDTTYVYSPGVARQLDEIFEAYGAYGPDEPHEPHTSETWMLGRPVHAEIQALITCARETRISQYTDDLRRHTREQNTPKNTLWRRLFLSICAGPINTLRHTPNQQPPSFDHPHTPPLLQYASREFRSLPLNWLPTENHRPPIWSNWLQSSNSEATPTACSHIWRTFVEPRLIHASHDRGVGCRLETWLSSNSNCGGNGILGDEWQPLDRLYWTRKMVHWTYYYWQDNKINTSMPGAHANLYREFEDLTSHLHNAAASWAALGTWIESGPRPSSAAALEDPRVAAAAALYRRQSAIVAFRHGLDPASDWRLAAHQRGINAYLRDVDVISAAIGT